MEQFIDYKQVISNSQIFTDNEFPPTVASIFDPSDYSENANIELYSSLEWKRASEIFPQENGGFEIFPKEIHEYDIIQGQLGDCYFVQCLASLSSKPERVKKLLQKTQTVNSSGCYVVTLCVNGIWQDIIIDDYLPVLPGTTKIVFGHSRTTVDEANGYRTKGVIWVSLVEKAWAKLNSNYDRIVMGTLDMGFIHLCGQPSKIYKHLIYKTQKDIVWQKLVEAENNGFLMAAGTSDEKNKIEQLKQNGLRSNHCYSIMSSHFVENKGKQVRLLKLRNPWGCEEWNGAWSKKSNLLTDIQKEELGLTCINDGIFCMTLEDFLLQFSITYICKYFDKSLTISQILNPPVPEKSFFIFDLNEQFMNSNNNGLEILVNQMGDRLTRRKRKIGLQFDPSWFSIILARINEDNSFTYIKSSVSSNYQVELEVEHQRLQAGSYFIIIEAIWNKCSKDPKSQFQSFCLKLQSMQQLQLNQKILQAEQKDQILREILISKSLQNQAKCQILPYKSRKDSYKIVDSQSQETFYGCIIFVNNSGQEIDEDIQFERLENFEPVGGFQNNSKQMNIKCFPGQKQIILLKRINENNANFHFKAQMRAGNQNAQNPNMLMLPQNIKKVSASPNKMASSHLTQQPNKNLKSVSPAVQKKVQFQQNTQPKIQKVQPAINSVAFAQMAGMQISQSKPGVQLSNDEIIQKIKSNPKLKKQQLVKNVKIYSREFQEQNCIYILFENEESEKGFECKVEFKLSGYTLQSLENEQIVGNTIYFQLESCSMVLRKLISEKKEQQKRGGFGGFAMADIINDYDQAAKSYSFKVSIKQNEE